MILTVQLVKDRSIHNTRGAFVTFEIIGGDIMEHILLSVAPPGTVFEMSYEIVEAGTQKGNLHDTGNTSNPDQDHDLPILDIDTHTSTSNEKDSPIPDRPKGGELAKWAGILCNDPMFWKYVGVTDSEGARKLITGACHVSSRTELDHDKKAAEYFREITRNFDEWRRRQNIAQKPDNTLTVDEQGELKKLAYDLCDDEEFWQWAGVDSAGGAMTYITNRCHVPSRFDLDYNKEGGIIFQQMVCKFDEWKKSESLTK